jgi:hypothetical protein
MGKAVRGGVVDGFPHDTNREWASNGESNSALVRLTWNEPVPIDRVWLFDRPNDLDQIKEGMILFSDGTTLKTGALPDDAKKWLVFLVTYTKKGSPNIGLSEIAVFKTK